MNSLSQRVTSVIVRASSRGSTRRARIDLLNASRLVDLKSEEDISNNDLASNHSGSLIKEIAGGENRSVDSSVDVDRSSRSQDVPNDVVRVSREAIAMEVDRPRSVNVDDPLSVASTVDKSEPSSRRKQIIADEDNVFRIRSGVASYLNSRELERSLSVGIEIGELVLKILVAIETRVENVVEAVRIGARAFDITLNIRGNRIILSSDKGLLVSRIKRATTPVDASSDERVIREIVRRTKTCSNAVTIAEYDRTLDGKSTLDISSCSAEVIETDDLIVLERKRLISKREAESRACVDIIEEWAIRIVDDRRRTSSR